MKGGSYSKQVGLVGTDNSPEPALLWDAHHQPPAMLVVDEDRDDFILLKRALCKTGSSARVWWAMNWQESLPLLSQLDGSTQCVCVVVEIRLNGTTGWDLLAKFRGESHRSKLKVVVLTGLTDERTRCRAAHESLDGFFVKACDPVGLREIARDLHRIATT